MPSTRPARNQAVPLGPADSADRRRVGLASRLQWSPFAMRLVGRYAFPLITRMLADDDVLFLNWAYEEDPPMALPLAASDEPNRFPIQLYHRTATQTDLAGKRVLEVSCGHGGGAEYLVRALRPASYTGLDSNGAGIDFCRRRHDLPGLDFVHGDAEHLPFPDRSFDAVINIESAHLYPSFAGFLAEVVRVLRPGGHFLYGDLRPRHQVAAWEEALDACALRMVEQEEINAQVLLGTLRNPRPAQDLVAAAMARWMSHRVPGVHGAARKATGVEGSGIFRAVESGEISYRLYSFIRD